MDDVDDCACSTDSPDGFDDLKLKFRVPDILASMGSISDGQVRTLTLTGSLLDGTPVEARACVVIVGIPQRPEGKRPITARAR